MEEIREYEPSEEEFAVPDVPVDYPLLRALSKIVLAGIAVSILPAVKPRRKVKR